MFNRKNYEMKKWHWMILAAIILLSFGLKIYAYCWPKTTVVIGGQTLTVLVANNVQHQIEGWSNKKDMGKYGGMLFVFGKRGQHSMVMREMRFPLDIIWLDGDEVVEIAPNLQPDPAQNESGLNPYFARAPSTRILELPAGFAQKYGVKIGDKVKILDR